MEMGKVFPPTFEMQAPEKRRQNECFSSGKFIFATKLGKRESG
jgi:hypothetical protein